MIPIFVLLIIIFIIYVLAVALDADIFEAVLVAMIVIGSVAALMVMFYLALTVWRCLR